jgi:imidazolonepropionase-like amidohydrolase
MNESDDILLMQSIANARQYLNLGVTTIRDNGSKNNTTLSLREGIRRGLAAGPRLILCGNPLTITGGHMWQMGGQADGVDGVIAAVRRVLKMGADYIKVAATGGTTLGTYPNLPAYNPDELRALIGEVHKFQKRVAAHVHATQAIIDLQEAGLSGRDMIIHCTWREPDGSSRYRHDVAARIAELGAWVNPTLHQAIGSKRERLREKGNTEGLTPAERARLDELERLYPERLEQIRQMADAGIKFVTGTDCGWGQVPFNEIHKEMDLLVQAGLSPMRAILSATKDAAESVGVGEVVGTLEPGKAADVAVFRGVPHRDVNDIANVLAVFQGGKRVR